MKFNRVIRTCTSSLLALSIIFLSSGINVLAAQTQDTDSKQDIISFEEYSSTIKAEYAKYGIKYEILENNEDRVLTKDMLEKQLLTANQQGEAYKQEQELNLKARETLEENLDETNIFYPMIMYVTKTYYNYQIVSSPSGMGNAQICLEGQATADADKGVFLWTNYSKSYQSGPYVNFKSWSQSAADCFLYTFPGSSTKLLALYVNGTLTVEYVEPTTGLLVGYTSSHALNIMWGY